MPPTGRKLVADVNARRVPPGRCAFWWLGQHGFIVKLARSVLYLDAFLSPLKARLVRPLLTPEQATNADLFCGTHDHVDHIDRAAWPALAAASPGAKFVVPELLRQRLSAELGVSPGRFLGLDDGKAVKVGDVKITGLAAAHELLAPDPATGMHPYLGYVIEANGCRVYHAGDTCSYEGLQTKLSAWRFDVAFLPINGRDAERLRRNCIGNMTYQEAADLAGAIQPALTIPAHYDTFEGNREDPSLFTEYMRVKYPRLKTRICRYGQAVMAP